MTAIATPVAAEAALPAANAKIHMPVFTLDGRMTAEQIDYLDTYGFIRFRRFADPETLRGLVEDVEAVDRQWMAEGRTQINGVPLIIGARHDGSRYVQRMAFTPLIDTFLAPAALFLGIAHFTAGEKRGLALILHVALLANALLGLYEFATGWRLTPFTPSADGVEFESDWRSSAFLGHPLANAMTTGVYALILAQGGGRDLPAVLRPVALAVQLVAMVAFGGRASLVILAMLLLVVALRGGFRLARGRELDLAQAGLALLALPVLAIVLDQAIASGFFDRLVERFVDDKGSAKSRLVLMHIVGQFSLGDLLIGPDPGKLATLQGVEGVEFGIESFWIGMILAYGVIASCFLFAGLAFFCREVMRETRRGSGLVLVFFIAVASTSVSLSAKSLMLAQMAVLSLVLLARDGSARAGPLPERGDA